MSQNEVSNDQSNSAIKQNEDAQNTDKQATSTTPLNPSIKSDESDNNDPTKNMTKAEKRVYDAKEKLRLAELDLEKEKEAEKERNTQDILKLLDKKKLLEIPLSVWKNNLKDISDLLNS
ncbi:hypothetical protein [Acinetobacter johnsonii]|uniref:Uncharacterized protein n=1 Tax=Acinetobacter johnsonii SH046 TaxID=575586 RepID=D0SGZ8_ACIJO|nr:hypothetical protein [Acinetobacter johnsonii]EEY94854.1 hypothetical protein HMPREF0016_03121 [Acinetobacter johnsonii SH046]